MAQLIKHRTATVDTWKTLELAEGETPESVELPSGDVIFPLAVWQVRKAEIISCHKRIGLLFQPDGRVEDIAGDLEYFVVIAVIFRNSSMAVATPPPPCSASATTTRANCALSATCCTINFFTCSASASTAMR